MRGWRLVWLLAVALLALYGVRTTGAAGAVPGEWVRACLLRYHWTPAAVDQAIARYPISFSDSGGFQTPNGPITVVGLGRDFCPMVDHEERHGYEFAAYGYPPWPGLRTDMQRLSRDRLHPAAAEAVSADLFTNPSDDWHLSQDLIDRLHHDYGLIPSWYGAVRFGYIDPIRFDHTAARVLVPLVGDAHARR